MPSAEKQKKQKEPSRKARGQMTRAAYRGQAHSNIAFERFMRGAEPHLFLAKVERALGGGRFDLIGSDGGAYHSVSVKGSLGLSRKAARNPAMRTAVDVGGHVLTDGARIHAVLTSTQAGQVRRAAGERSGSAKSKNSLFSWASYSSHGLENKAATRKAGHKGARSRSANSTRSVASSASSTGSKNVLLVAGKKVYTAAGEKLHGEGLRAAKRHLGTVSKA